MTFWDHVGELRSRIMWAFFALLGGVILAHYYHEPLIEFILRPMKDNQLFFLSPLDPLLFILKIDFVFGLIIAFPIISCIFFSFLKPAMREITWLLFAGIYTLIATTIFIGLSYVYFIVAPIALDFLLSINVPGTVNMITATSYVNFILVQAFIIAIIFQIPLIVVAGVYMDFFDVRSLASKRKYIYVAGLILCAIITPTADIFNLATVSVPAVIMFETSLVLGRIIASRKSAKEVIRKE